MTLSFFSWAIKPRAYAVHSRQGYSVSSSVSKCSWPVASSQAVYSRSPSCPGHSWLSSAWMAGELFKNWYHFTLRPPKQQWEPLLWLKESCTSFRARVKSQAQDLRGCSMDLRGCSSKRSLRPAPSSRLSDWITMVLECLSLIFMCWPTFGSPIKCFASRTGWGPAMVRPSGSLTGLPRALLNNLQHGAQCSAFRAGSFIRSLSFCLPCGVNRSYPKYQSKGSWTSISPVKATASVSRAFCPAKRSPNLGNTQSRRLHSLEGWQSPCRCRLRQVREQNAALHSGKAIWNLAQSAPRTSSRRPHHGLLHLASWRTCWPPLLLLRRVKHLNSKSACRARPWGRFPWKAQGCPSWRLRP